MKAVPIAAGVSVHAQVRRAQELIPGSGLLVQAHSIGTNVEGDLGTSSLKSTLASREPNCTTPAPRRYLAQFSLGNGGTSYTYAYGTGDLQGDKVRHQPRTQLTKGNYGISMITLLTLLLIATAAEAQEGAAPEKGTHEVAEDPFEGPDDSVEPLGSYLDGILEDHLPHRVGPSSGPPGDEARSRALVECLHKKDPALSDFREATLSWVALRGHETHGDGEIRVIAAGFDDSETDHPITYSFVILIRDDIMCCLAPKERIDLEDLSDFYPVMRQLHKDYIYEGSDCKW